MKIPHLEDFIMTANPTDVVEVLSALLHNVYSDIRLGSLSVKFDGLLVVYGMENGNFFISNKSYFNKTPIKFFSGREILDHPRWDIEKKEKLAWYFERLRNDHGYGIKASNWMRTAEVLKCPWSATGDFSSKPNILEYHFDHRFDFYYSNHLDSLESIRRRGNLPGEPPWDMFRAIAYNLKGCVPILWPENFAIFSKVVNLAIRKGEPVYHALCENSYSEADIYELATRFKEFVLTDCRQAVKTPGIQVMYDGEPSEHEGCIFRYKNHIIKLVDRQDFSAKNFSSNASRGWKID